MIRVAVSNVAKLCGLHEYADIPELLTELIYQDRAETLRKDDEKRWGITFVSEEEIVMKDILRRRGAEGLAVAVLRAKTATPSDTAQVQNVVDAAVGDKVEAVLKQSIMNEAEAELVRTFVRGRVYTNFGTRHEARAIEIYQKQTGWEVNECNEDMYYWAFPQDPTQLRAPSILTTDASDQGWRQNPAERSRSIESVFCRFCALWLPKTAYTVREDVDWALWAACSHGDGWIDFPPTLRSSERRLVHALADSTGQIVHASHGRGPSRHVRLYVNDDRRAQDVTRAVQTLVDQVVGEDTTSDGVELQNVWTIDRSDEHSPRASPVVLMGMVDGVAQELVCDQIDEDDFDHDASSSSWKMQSVVVEVKHRMKERRSTSSREPPFYDIIQSVCYMLMLGTTSSDLVECFRSKENDADIEVHRVELNAGPHWHEQNFYREIAPRLYAVADVVKSLRVDDDTRQAFVTASPLEQWRRVFEWLPFVRPGHHHVHRRALAASARRQPVMKRKVADEACCIDLTLGDDALTRKRSRLRTEATEGRDGKLLDEDTHLPRTPDTGHKRVGVGKSE